MKALKIKKGISITCSMLILIPSFIGLIIGLTSIGASGFAALGLLLLLPAVGIFSIGLFDFLITIDKIKNGLTYSYISTILKLIYIVQIIMSIIFNSIALFQFNISALIYLLILLALLVIYTIPSAFNVLNLKQKTNNHK